MPFKPVSTDNLGLTPTAVKTADYAAVVGDLVPVDTTGGNVTVTLPTAPADKSVVAIKHVIQGGTNTVGMATGGSDVFNKTGGGTTGTLTLVSQGILLQYKSSGAIWYAIADDIPLSGMDARFAGLASPTLTGTPAAPTAAAGTNTTQVATTAYAKGAAANSTYRTILHTGGIKQQSVAANTSFCSLMNDNLIAAGASTVSSAFNPDLIYILAADFPTVNGATTTLRVKVVMATNATAPTGNFTFGLYPITKAASSGGTGANIYTYGSVITGSTVVFTTPAADTLSTGVSTDFAIPSDGVYAIGVVTTATSAAGSQEQVNVDLQMKN